MKSAVIGLPLVAMLAVVWTQDAGAAKKLSYEQAWATCKKEIGANAPGSDTTASASRHTAGAACMRKYGYRLKKS